ncbi:MULTISPECIES: hypothetical protein [Halomicrobium]|nr:MULTISPECIES: hypothetical protein [Halomicrobium]QCD64717.1 hypothetical protein E5139_03310 [Halomicrobium mukohataei]QFR19524.1 hypothetical protein GBQ70_03310 [Halomicrobium sp. ZPS1]
MQHVLVRFEIPYHIEVPDGIESDDDGPMFFPQVFGHPFGLSFERTSGDSGIEGTVTVKRDRLGKATRSKVQGTIHHDVYKSIPAGGPDEIPGAVAMMGSSMQDREGRAIKSVIMALNKFLQHYRQNTGYHWIRPLVVEDIIRFRIRTDERGFRNRSVTGGPLELGAKTGLTENKARQMAEALKNNESANTYLQLHLDVLNKVDLGEFRTAIILSFNLFESWAKNAFVAAKISSENTELEARESIQDDSGQYYAIYNIVTDHYPKAGVEFEDYCRFDQWYDDFYEIRNKVVHEGYLPDKETVRSAHEECLDAIRHLQKEFGSDIEGSSEKLDFISFDESPFASRHK